jgi:hypothetical protein
MSANAFDEIMSVTVRASLIQSGIASIVVRADGTDPMLDRLTRTDRRLKRSVIRPLNDCLALLGATEGNLGAGTPIVVAPSVPSIADDLDRLANDTTVLAARPGLPAEIQEGAAALAGTMPCDGAWPIEKIDVFRQWIASEMLA